jgi:hypothetical protein
VVRGVLSQDWEEGAALARQKEPAPFEKAMALRRMRAAIDLQELAFCYAAAEFAATDFWDEDGSVSAIDWIRINCHMTSNAAADRVRVGEHLGKLSKSVGARR